jgi:hypothetical protein
MMEIIAAVAVLVIVAFFVYKKKKKVYSDIFVPVPDVWRDDILYGYYGAYDKQAEETVDHINFFWDCHFQGDAKTIENILTAKCPTVLSCGDQLFYKFKPTGRNHKLHPVAESTLRQYFQTLSDAGALIYVKGLTPFDEPNTNVESADELRRSMDILKKVAAEFPELHDVRYAIIYAAEPETYDCIELFHYVGLDDYSKKSSLLTDGTYDRLRNRLAPWQKTILIPGACFGQDPTPFINFAGLNEEVGIVLPFVWFKAPKPEDVNAIEGHPWFGLGEPMNPLRAAYVQAGKTVTKK